MQARLFASLGCRFYLIAVSGLEVALHTFLSGVIYYCEIDFDWFVRFDKKYTGNERIVHCDVEKKETK